VKSPSQRTDQVHGDQPRLLLAQALVFGKVHRLPKGDSSNFRFWK
jgi:hypothetical protein